MKNNFFYLIVAILISQVSISNAQNLKVLNSEQWTEDITFLAKSVKQIFPSFQSRDKGKKFLQMITDLKSNINSRSPESIVYEMQKSLNALEDEGCNIIPFQEKLNTKILPIMIYPFQDGWFICDAKQKGLKGNQILKINNFKMDDVYRTLIPYINADNEFYRKRLFSAYCLVPSLLNVAGIGESNDEVMLLLASGKEILVKAESIKSYANLNRKLPNDGYFLATNTSHQNENYWYEYVPNTKTIFLQLQLISNSENGSSFSKFVSDIEKEIKKGELDKIIIDVRYGGGGNGFKLKTFTDLLRDSKNLNKRGNLFVLTSKTTKGTLLELASILELNTNAILIGEPTAEGPNTVGDTNYIQLPNSKLNISLTKIFWPTSWYFDNRKTIQPEIDIIYTSKHHQLKEDPWLTKALNYSETKIEKYIEKEIKKAIVGTYEIKDRKITIKEDGDKLKFQMRRKLKSFFELNGELFYKTEGVLNSSIRDVSFYYDKDSKGKIILTCLNWKGVKVNFKS